MMMIHLIPSTEMVAQMFEMKSMMHTSMLVLFMVHVLKWKGCGQLQRISSPTTERR